MPKDIQFYPKGYREIVESRKVNLIVISSSKNVKQVYRNLTRAKCIFSQLSRPSGNAPKHANCAMFTLVCQGWKRPKQLFTLYGRLWSTGSTSMTDGSNERCMWTDSIHYHTTFINKILLCFRIGLFWRSRPFYYNFAKKCVDRDSWTFPKLVHNYYLFLITYERTLQPFIMSGTELKLSHVTFRLFVIYYWPFSGI